MADLTYPNAAANRNLVRSGDQDRYWATLLAPNAVRDDLFALYAFHLELARIPQQVSEPQLGEIRLQWWREALAAALTSGEAEHPLVGDLARAAHAHSLPSRLLEAMIDARSFDLRREPMPNFTALLDYLGATAGSVFELGAQILGSDGEANGAATQAGIAYGLVGLMRALPYHAARGQVFLPGDVLAKHGLHPEAILRGATNDDARAVIRDLGARASAAMAAYRLEAVKLSRRARPAFLPLALIEPFLKRLNDRAHDPLRDIVQLNPLARYGLIWRAHLRGKI